MRMRSQLYILVSILLIVGISLTAYKHFVLGFSLTPGGIEKVWQVQARIKFEAEGGPVKIVFSLPSKSQNQKLLSREIIAQDYQYNEIESEGVRKIVLTRADVKGEQTLYLSGEFYATQAPDLALPSTGELPAVVLQGAQKLAGEELLSKAHLNADSSVRLTLSLLEMTLKEDQHSDGKIKLLLENTRYRHEILEQLANVLALDGIHARVMRGLRLEGQYTQRSITSFIRVYDGNKWVLLDPSALSEVPFTEVLLWPQNTGSILDVFGGSNSRVDLSVTSVNKSVDRLAVEAAQEDGVALIDFSIYSLPIKDQNTFKLLLHIPFGILVVVILRNLVGIRTSGTFMPVLIALTFMQTTLLLGLVLFLIVVSIGLILRSFLSHLNLLLVPRIASVLVFVVVIFAGIGIGSHKFGWESGLAITFFPMIILAWTIERMSVLWEEEGPKEVLIQGGGSLLTASLAYALMTDPSCAHLAFTFPELLLVVLAIIIMIGSYSGFRLLELWRFEPMTREQ